MDEVVVEEVFCLRCADWECMKEVAVWAWSLEEVALKIPIWKSSARWLAAVQPTPGHLLACSQGRPLLEASPARGWRAGSIVGQVNTSGHNRA